jgi:hypothetical protein
MASTFFLVGHTEEQMYKNTQIDMILQDFVY